MQRRPQPREGYFRRRDAPSFSRASRCRNPRGRRRRLTAVEQAVSHQLASTSARGRVSVATDVVAQIVARTASEVYGVVGLAPRTGVARLLDRGRQTQGVTVVPDSGGVQIDLHVVVEHGLNLAEVASSVRNRVTYEVGRLTGLRVGPVEVHIDSVRRSP